jgi:4-methylaminobutanoate oxidase (formaldehyde-forming)
VLGETDVVLLEQGRLTSGTTWHAAGLVGQLRNHESMTRLIRYSTDLYSRLEGETGLSTGWKQCGSLAVAQTADRMIQLKRTAAVAQAYGVACEVISPATLASSIRSWRRPTFRERCGCPATARRIRPT